jgi:hypothetical protein
MKLLPVFKFYSTIAILEKLKEFYGIDGIFPWPWDEITVSWFLDKRTVSKF